MKGAALASSKSTGLTLGARFGPLARACRSWKRRFGRLHLQAWHNAAVRATQRRSLSWQEDRVVGDLRVWWLHWRAAHHRCRCISRAQTGMHAPLIWLRLAHHAWRSVAAGAPAARREQYFAQRHWFDRWHGVGYHASAAASRRINAVAANRLKRNQMLARQWLARAYAMCVFTRVQAESARAITDRRLGRWVLAQWTGLVATARRIYVGVGAALCRLTRRQVWAHWTSWVQCRAGLRGLVRAWQRVALNSFADTHRTLRQCYSAFRAWAHHISQIFDRRLRGAVLARKFASRQATAHVQACMARCMGGWLRFCNQQLAHRTADALFLVRVDARATAGQRDAAELVSAILGSWHGWAARLAEEKAALTTASNFALAKLTRHYLGGWIMYGRKVALSRQRKHQHGRARAHRQTVLLTLVFWGWGLWARQCAQVEVEEIALAKGVRRLRLLRGSWRRWRRRARRLAGCKDEMAGLHMRKAIIVRVLHALRAVTHYQRSQRHRCQRTQDWLLHSGTFSSRSES